MFGSTSPFGQSSSSPFGSQSVFGQTSSATSNPFAPKPFGSTSPFGSQAGGSSPFGSQTGGSIFGGTSTGVFGATQSSSPLGSTPAFGASSTPAFGSSAPAFGASSTPAFGSSSPFGGSSVFGQKPAFGGFGSSPSQTSPFGSAFQQTQSAYGSNLFGSSTPFGASTPTFGASSTPAFGATTSTPAFGATTSTPAFGASSTPAFGSTGTPAFGSTNSVFGASSTPTFGSTPFGASSTPAFGASSTPAFGASSTPAFGATNTSAFGASTPSFSFGSTPAFGQTSSAFGSSPFGTTPSPFGAQSSPFGSQTTTATFGTPGFGQPGFSGQPGGSRVAPYSPTSEVDGTSGTQPAGKLESISAMPIYKDKSHEELRWEDYQRGDKGGPNPASQSASVLSFGSPAQSNPFGASTSSAFSQTSANPFASSTSSNPFAPKPQTFGHSGFGATSASAFSTPFSAASTSPFGAASTTPSLFGSASTTAFGAGSSPSLFGASSTPAFGSSSSIFGSASAPASTPSFGSSLTFGNTQSTGLFSSSTPLGQTTSAFGQTGSAFGQGMSAFGQTNPFSTPPSGFGGNLFASSSAPSILGSSPAGFGQATPSLSTPFQPAPLGQTTSAFSFGNIGQTQPASGGFGATSSGFGQGIFGQSSAPTQSNIIMQPTAISNPFGTLPAMPQLSIGHAGSAPSVQYGISSMPVSDKPAPARISALATPRHLSQRRIKLPARKYHPRKDGPMIPFFSNDEETPSTPKADALFLPRENPRSLVVRPVDQWPSRTNGERQSLSKDVPTPVHENGKIPEGLATQNGYNSQEHDKISAENGFNKQEDAFPGKSTPKLNGDTTHKGDSYIPISGHRAGEAAIVYEHGADIEALMPKLRHSDYYTEPRIQELAAKERAEPGYCRHVKDFVVGRHGYGGIKFLGETDVRRLDLESIVQFNMREVIVYLDESKKPPIGQGLNKPAEVTLLNIKGSNKKTGEQYTHGPKLDKYKEMLKKKTEDQGAEFLSYDPGKGEWKFKVDHFSQYSLAGEGDLLACCSLDLCVDE